MFTPLLRALGQLDDPAILWLLARALAVSALSFIVLALAATASVHHLVAGHGWLSTLASALGGVLALVSALWLFLPLAVLIAGFFGNGVCAAVERRWYPYLPPARGAGLGEQAAEALTMAALMLAASLVSLLVALIPGPGWVAAMLITGWALGRALFGAVALRRMGRRAALLRYREQRWQVLAQGLALALAGAVPLLNLLIPVLGPAAMLHIVMGQEGNNKSWG